MNWQGQAVLAVDMMFWTSQAEEAMKKSGIAGLQQYYEKLNKEVSKTFHQHRACMIRRMDI